LTAGQYGGPKWTYTAQALKAFVGELGDKDRVSVTLFESSFQDFAEAPLPVSELKMIRPLMRWRSLVLEAAQKLLPALEHILKTDAGSFQGARSGDHHHYRWPKLAMKRVSLNFFVLTARSPFTPSGSTPP